MDKQLADEIISFCELKREFTEEQVAKDFVVNGKYITSSVVVYRFIGPNKFGFEYITWVKKGPAVKLENAIKTDICQIEGFDTYINKHFFGVSHLELAIRYNQQKNKPFGQHIDAAGVINGYESEEYIMCSPLLVSKFTV
jgi:hypothetical protein